MKTLQSIIAQQSFFAGLQPDYVKLLTSCASNTRFKAGQYIVREGQEANQFFLIRTGTVAVEILPPVGKPIVIDTLGEGEVLGWSWLLSPKSWKFDLRTVDEVRAIEFDGTCLRAKCEENHDLGYELLKRFAQIVDQRLEATHLRLLDTYSGSLAGHHTQLVNE
jgi:CRP-like cAMP-binding protein